jgi:hypothetical protein
MYRYIHREPTGPNRMCFKDLAAVRSNMHRDRTLLWNNVCGRTCGTVEVEPSVQQQRTGSRAGYREGQVDCVDQID